MSKQWEIGQFSQGKEVLKEVGPMGRFLFGLTEYPGLGIDAEPIRATLTAAPEMLAALKADLAAIDAYLKATGHVAGVEPQRKALIASGNAVAGILAKAGG
ncbi:hypothetical protein [Mesorhizobium sp.]|uniref:hypothetical protein n=1 Tax=Mesorhizobium sp. TaxID=1871066 RepID=UPI000FE7254A|nr:hypothetical protein [Mesorhizobium sp.]RWP29507.1 MAG: hypothetical protein EOR03_26640 [Mesorhizobium sp.]